MKKIIAAIAALLVVAVASPAKTTSEKNISTGALQSFNQKFQGVAVRKWVRSHDTETARFVMGHRKVQAVFLADGTWVETDKKLPWSWDLPAVVDKGWKHCLWSSWNIENINEVDQPGGKKYRIEVYSEYGPDGSIPEDNMQEVELYFNTDGQLVGVDPVDE